MKESAQMRVTGPREPTKLKETRPALEKENSVTWSCAEVDSHWGHDDATVVQTPGANQRIWHIIENHAYKRCGLHDQRGGHCVLSPRPVL